jgi:polyphosphate kinase
VPVEDKEARKRLTHILETHFKDTSRGRVLRPDGVWAIPALPGARAVRSQEIFAKEAAKRARQTIAADVLVPHTPKG